jgi:multiple sugar transport system substrate-binding protein
MKCTSRKKRLVALLSIIGLLALSSVVSAQAKSTATFFWAQYDGVTEDYRASLQAAFNKIDPNTQIEIVPVPWDQLKDKLTTALAGGAPPDISIIGTRWLLEYDDLKQLADPTKYVSKKTLDDILAGAKEGVIKGKLMGLPVAAGARFMAINNSIAKDVPKTMEQLETDAIAANSPPDHYGLFMVGQKNTELTEFAYYLYAAGGDFFAKNADGSYGKSAVNSPAGVQALTFMNKLANKDKVVEDGYLGLTRIQGHPLFYANKIGYVMIGAWVDSAMKQAGATFPVTYAQIPGFKGHPSTPLIITDSIAFFSGGKNLSAAGKFINFWYNSEWKGKFDELAGFPPVTKSASSRPAFNTPMYKVMGEAAAHAKGWPLIATWDQCQDVIWDAVSKVFLEQATPKAALDEAAAAIDKINNIK